MRGGETMKKQCTACKSEIDAKATKCPHCGTSQTSMVKGIVSLILGIIIMVGIFNIIGTITGSSKSSTTATTNAGSTQNTQVETANIGDTVTDGTLAFTVNSMTTAQTLGDYDVKTAQGMYYILTVKIQNNGKETQTINASDFSVVDSQGRKYDYSTDGQTAMEETDGTTDFFLQQVQPGLSVTGKIVFDVPASATGLKLMAQGDLFSNPVSINLGK